MDKLKIKFNVDLLQKTLGLPDEVEIIGVKYDPIAFSETHMVIMIAGDNLPEKKLILQESDSLVGLCKDFFE